MQEVIVVNVNRRGEVFDPRMYKVSAAENPELYQKLKMRGIKYGNSIEV